MDLYNQSPRLGVGGDDGPTPSPSHAQSPSSPPPWSAIGNRVPKTPKGSVDFKTLAEREAPLYAILAPGSGGGGGVELDLKRTWVRPPLKTSPVKASVEVREAGCYDTCRFNGVAFDKQVLSTKRSAATTRWAPLPKFTMAPRAGQALGAPASLSRQQQSISPSPASLERAVGGSASGFYDEGGGGSSGQQHALSGISGRSLTTGSPSSSRLAVSLVMAAPSEEPDSAVGSGGSDGCGSGGGAGSAVGNLSRPSLAADLTTAVDPGVAAGDAPGKEQTKKPPLFGLREPDAGSIFAANLPQIRACAVKPPAWIQEPGARQQRSWVLQGKGSDKDAPAKSVRPGVVFL